MANLSFLYLEFVRKIGQLLNYGHSKMLQFLTLWKEHAFVNMKAVIRTIPIIYLMPIHLLKLYLCSITPFSKNFDIDK